MMIRTKLDDLADIEKLDFDLQNRNLTVYHREDNPEIGKRLHALDLGATLIGSEIVTGDHVQEPSTVQAKVLWTVLIINLSFFVIEMTTGLLSQSMGLVADSLDMLADTFVYGLSLWAVGSSVLRKKKVAVLSGYFQMTLALLGIAEVVRRFIGFESMPDYRIMIIVSGLALAANAVCLYLLQRSRSTEAHMKASMIFTSNDVIINAGVIAAGVLVLLTQSKYPDLIVGSVVFIIVVRGAIRILKLGR